MEWDAYIRIDMPREEVMYMFLQEVIDQSADGCAEMTDVITIISLIYHNNTDQESILTEVVQQDLIMVSIMEMEDHKESLTESSIIREAARVLQ